MMMGLVLMAGCGHKSDWVYYYCYYESEYRLPWEDVIIAFRESADGPEGRFWGTSDEFLTAREGYLPGFCVLPLQNLTFAEDGKEVSFTLHFGDDIFFSDYIDVDIHSADEARKAGYHTWLQDPGKADKNDVAFRCRMAGDSMVVTTDLYYPEEPEWNRRTFRRMTLDEIRAIDRKMEPQDEKANRRKTAAETAEPGAEEVAANVARIEKFYKAYMNPEGRTNTQRLTERIFTPRVLEKINRVGESGGYDPIIDAQDTNEHGVKTMKCRHLGGDWYEVSYWWDEQKQIVKSLKVVGQGEDMRIDYLSTWANPTVWGDSLFNIPKPSLPDETHGAEEFVKSFYAYYTYFYAMMQPNLETELEAVRNRYCAPELRKDFAAERKAREGDMDPHFDILVNNCDFDLSWYRSLTVEPFYEDGNFLVSFRTGENPGNGNAWFTRLQVYVERDAAGKWKVYGVRNKGERHDTLTGDSASVFRDYLAQFVKCEQLYVKDGYIDLSPVTAIHGKDPYKHELKDEYVDRFLRDSMSCECERSLIDWFPELYYERNGYIVASLSTWCQGPTADTDIRCQFGDQVLVTYTPEGKLIDSRTIGRSGDYFDYFIDNDSISWGVIMMQATLLDSFGRGEELHAPKRIRLQHMTYDLNNKGQFSEFVFLDTVLVDKWEYKNEGKGYRLDMERLFKRAHSVPADSSALLLGRWFNMAEELRHTHFSMTLKQDGDSCIVDYSAVALGGNRIDDSNFGDEDAIKIPMSEIKGKDMVTFQGKFTYSGITGKVQIRQLNPDSIEWKILEIEKGSYFVPELDTLTRQ